LVQTSAAVNGQAGARHQDSHTLLAKFNLTGKNRTLRDQGQLASQGRGPARSFEPHRLSASTVGAAPQRSMEQHQPAVSARSQQLTAARARAGARRKPGFSVGAVSRGKGRLGSGSLRQCVSSARTGEGSRRGYRKDRAGGGPRGRTLLDASTAARRRPCT
jgi:hypothetical protein